MLEGKFGDDLLLILPNDIIKRASFTSSFTDFREAILQ